MIETTPKTSTVTLKNGRVLVLGELSLFDLSEGEKILGKPADQWMQSIPGPTADEPDRMVTKVEDPLRTLSCILWLLARKEGLERSQILARRWKFSLDELMLDLSLGDLEPLGPILVRHFSVGGTGPGEADRVQSAT